METVKRMIDVLTRNAQNVVLSEGFVVSARILYCNKHTGIVLGWSLSEMCSTRGMSAPRSK